MDIFSEGVAGEEFCPGGVGGRDSQIGFFVRRSASSFFAGDFWTSFSVRATQRRWSQHQTCHCCLIPWLSGWINKSGDLVSFYAAQLFSTCMIDILGTKTVIVNRSSQVPSVKREVLVAFGRLSITLCRRSRKADRDFNRRPSGCIQSTFRRANEWCYLFPAEGLQLCWHGTSVCFSFHEFFYSTRN